MSPKIKQRKIDDEESEDSYSSDSSEESNEAYDDNEVWFSFIQIKTIKIDSNRLNENKLSNHTFYAQVIQVDFEGRNPMTSDFHGIRQLLHQLFLKSDINLSELTDIVTGMNREHRFVHHAITH